MRIDAVLMTALACAASCAGAQEATIARELPFAAGGSVRITLRVGDVEIVGSDDEKIAVSWHPSTAQTVTVNLERTAEKEATLRLEGPSNKVHYRIQVPKRSGLAVGMHAGNLDIRGVSGNLDVHLLAGNVDIRLPDSSAVGNVSAAVVSGGLTAKPWKVDKGGLARFFETTGPGEFDLHAQVLAGQLTIR
jgi:hypothetical protein